MTTTETPLDTARRPAAVEATIAVVRELAAEARVEGLCGQPDADAAVWGARRVLARLTGARYFVGSGVLLDRWDQCRAVPRTSGLPRRELRALAAEQNTLNAAEVDDELRAELVALDPGLHWPAVL